MTIPAKSGASRPPRVPVGAMRSADTATQARPIAGKAVPRPQISAEEMARRREALRQADASNRIEGVFRSRASDPIYEAFIRGEIEVTDMVPLFKAQLAGR